MAYQPPEPCTLWQVMDLPVAEAAKEHIVSALENLGGWDVTVIEKPSLESKFSMLAKVDRFAKSLDGGCEAFLVVFAGYGMEAAGRRFLVPSGISRADLESTGAVEEECVELTAVWDQFRKRATRGGIRKECVGVFLLDCCTSFSQPHAAEEISPAPGLSDAFTNITVFASAPSASSAASGRDGSSFMEVFAGAMLAPSRAVWLVVSEIEGELDDGARVDLIAPSDDSCLPFRGRYSSPPPRAAVSADTPDGAVTCGRHAQAAGQEQGGAEGTSTPGGGGGAELEEKQFLARFPGEIKPGAEIKYKLRVGRVTSGGAIPFDGDVACKNPLAFALGNAAYPPSARGKKRSIWFRNPGEKAWQNVFRVKSREGAAKATDDARDLMDATTALFPHGAKRRLADQLEEAPSSPERACDGELRPTKRQALGNAPPCQPFTLNPQV